MEFGVESVDDMVELTDQDLVEMGMKPLQRRRILQAAKSLNTVTPTVDGDAEHSGDEFVKVEEMDTDDEDEVDEDLDTITKAIESSSCTPRTGHAPNRSTNALSVLPKQTQDERIERTDLKSIATSSVPSRHSEEPGLLLTHMPPSHREADAKLLVSDTVTVAKRKLRSMSYGSHGQEPRKLFSHYDRDNSGELDWNEFKSAIRKGGRVSIAAVGDDVLRHLFDAVDSDGSGNVSIEELTEFVWGNQNRLAQDGARPMRASDHVAPPADQLEQIGGALLLPSRAERDAAFDCMDVNDNGALSLAEIDKAIVEIWPEYNHKKSIMLAYKAADVDGSGYIGRKEFALLLKYMVYFDKMWDKFSELDRDGDGRLDVKEFHAGAQTLGLDVTWATTSEEFGSMDEDGSGTVLFDEFCAWCARRGVPAAKPKTRRTTASQKESAARLTASAYAGRRASPADAATQQKPPVASPTRTPHNKIVFQRRNSSAKAQPSTSRTRDSTQRRRAMGTQSDTPFATTRANVFSGRKPRRAQLCSVAAARHRSAQADLQA
eukprot:COSAG02_NODE_10284_length_1978_cov_1.522086_1_plen_546_part_10